MPAKKAVRTSKKKTPTLPKKKARASQKKARAAPKTRARSSSTKARLPAERSADERLVQRTVDHLVAHNRSVAASKRNIGAFIIDAYFDGDAALARSNDPTKPKSFARLLDRAGPEAGWDLRDLRESVRIELCARTLPGQVADAIPATYLLALAAVDDLETRRALAARIAEGTLRGDAADQAITAAAATEDRRGGRPPVPGPERFIANLERDLERAQSDALFSARELATLAAPARTALRARLAATRAALARFEQLLGG